MRPNSIYYANVGEHKYNDQNVYVFELEDRSTTTELPSPTVGYQSDTTWVGAQHKFIY